MRKVLVRAYGSEPLVRYAEKSKDGTVMIRNEKSYRRWLSGMGADDCIGWPSGDVYQFQEGAFKRIKDLYESGKSEQVEREWADLEATRF